MKTSTWERGIGIGIRIGAIAVVAAFAPPLWAFDTFEHRHLGNVAYERATRASEESLPKEVKANLVNFMKELDKFDKTLEVNKEPCVLYSQIKPSQCMAIKALRDVPVRFGDFAALAGDHAGTPAEVYEMVQNFVHVGKDDEEVKRILATRRQWQRACAQMRALYYQNGGEPDYLDLYCVKDHGYWSQSTDAVLPLTGYSPQRDEWSEFEALPGFVDLVSSNQSHFPTHSWREYAVHHDAALQAAKSYADVAKPYADMYKGCQDPKIYGTDTPMCHLRRALVNEGYAQHFLHDSFASGHIGTEFGKCLFYAFLCAPDKQLVHHVHNELNRLGLKVTFNTEGVANDAPGGQQILMAAQNRFGKGNLKLEDFRKGWLAAGDDFLMVPQAGLHREIISRIATASLIEVLETMGKEGSSEHTLEKVCMRWVNVFPQPADPQLMSDIIKREALCKTNEKKEGSDEEEFSDNTTDLAKFQADQPRFWPSLLWPDPGLTHRLLGRTMDDRVRIYPLEGWKFMLTWGPAWGRFDELNDDGTIQHPENHSTGGTFEVGYVRKTKWFIPNYVGFGMALISGVRTSVYPLSVGWWGTTDSGTIFGGLRVNAGLRIEEALVEGNPGPRDLSSAECTIPLDIGFKIYKGLAFYIRPELLAIHFPGLGGTGQTTGAVAESIFNGYGRVTAGLILDFGEVF